jgi:hypothetical protein
MLVKQSFRVLLAGLLAIVVIACGDSGRASAIDRSVDAIGLKHYGRVIYDKSDDGGFDAPSRKVAIVFDEAPQASTNADKAFTERLEAVGFKRSGSSNWIRRSDGDQVRLSVGFVPGGTPMNLPNNFQVPKDRIGVVLRFVG